MRATILIDMPFALSQDVNTLWLRAQSGQIGSLASAAAEADTTLTLRAPLTANLVGVSLLIDNEPISVTAQSADGSSLTISRYAAAFPYMAMLPTPPITAHVAGAPIYQLTYATPWVYMTERYFRPGVQSDVISLGSASKSFGTSASGSLGLTPTS